MGQSYKTPSYALTFELGLIETQPTLLYSMQKAIQNVQDSQNGKF